MLEQVLAGRTCEEIGRRLYISPYTVQDHLKSIFAKTGVNSRRSLVAQLVYTEYLPRVGSEVGPDGWFAGSRAEAARGHSRMSFRETEGSHRVREVG